ncbi:MAG: hypothetical protein KTR19_04950 [Hyphomicrobiales bacterium]|nr:hypothetical protein [Hyphomicrobiales bacterium]
MHLRGTAKILSSEIALFRALSVLARQGEANPLRWMLSWTLIAVFTLSSMVAPGVMPTVRSGGLTIVICTGDGLVQLRPDGDSQPVDEEQRACVWSIHTSAADIVRDLPETTSIDFHATLIDTPIEIAVADQFQSNQNRPRAPPHIL